MSRDVFFNSFFLRLIRSQSLCNKVWKYKNSKYILVDIFFDINSF